MNILPFFRLPHLGAFLLIAALSLYSATGQSLFEEDTLLELTLSGPLFEILKDAPNATTWFPCRLTGVYQGSPFSIDVEVKARGNFRRKKTTCQFPPLRMKFAPHEGSPFAQQSKLKLVTHCQTRKTEFEQYLVKEYLAYRMYNVLTDTSHRVRLARINYIDHSERLGSFTRMAFFIEDLDKIADRLGAKEVTPPVVAPSDVSAPSKLRVALFAFMIGNTDWSISGQHNVELISHSPFSPTTAIPYDFDFSGLVSAPYAAPDARLGISSITERVYRGYCCSEVELRKGVDLFLDKKADLLSILSESSYLDSKNKKASIAYLEDFFKIISDAKQTEKRIAQACRKE